MKVFEHIILVSAVLLLFLPAGRAGTLAQFRPAAAADTLARQDSILLPDSLRGVPGVIVLSDSLFYVPGGEVPEGYELVDTLVFVPSERVDTALAGKNIFYLMPSRSVGGAADVHIYQSASIVSAMNRSFGTNATRPYTGYRVRIFFDNRQSARQDSEAMMESFSRMYPGVPAYRSYVNPYFKITVGDFRTKSEAMNFLQQIIHTFPKAFIVKENIEYPVLDRDSLGRTDTVQILRKLAGPETAL